MTEREREDLILACFQRLERMNADELRAAFLLLGARRVLPFRVVEDGAEKDASRDPAGTIQPRQRLNELA